MSEQRSGKDERDPSPEPEERKGPEGREEKGPEGREEKTQTHVSEYNQIELNLNSALPPVQPGEQFPAYRERVHPGRHWRDYSVEDLHSLHRRYYGTDFVAPPRPRPWQPNYGRYMLRALALPGTNAMTSEVADHYWNVHIAALQARLAAQQPDDGPDTSPEPQSRSRSRSRSRDQSSEDSVVYLSGWENWELSDDNNPVVNQPAFNLGAEPPDDGDDSPPYEVGMDMDIIAREPPLSPSRDRVTNREHRISREIQEAVFAGERRFDDIMRARQRQHARQVEHNRRLDIPGEVPPLPNEEENEEGSMPDFPHHLEMIRGRLRAQARYNHYRPREGRGG